MFLYVFIYTWWMVNILFGLFAEWSIYEVKLMFLIIYYDGNTEHYTARDVAHHWVTDTNTEKQKHIFLI